MRQLFLLLFSFGFYGFSIAQKADSSIIRKHMIAITKTDEYRNFRNLEQLNQIADYLKEEFSKHADTTYFQSYTVSGVEYKNVVAVFNPKSKKHLIIGAHYDVCKDQEGADDNASGTVGLLELARMLKDRDLNHRVELVAYTLEEPPFFRTEHMGSFIHAKSLSDKNAEVVGMICLEMIGYFKDEKKSQDYPIGILSWFYGSKGDYITLVKKFGAGKFVRQFNRAFKKTTKIETKKFSGPPSLPGIDFSDHLNYWKFDYPALMITDTAFYRNKNYHEKGDTLETLDLSKMAAVIDAVYDSILEIF